MTAPNPYDAAMYDLDDVMAGDEPDWSLDPPVPPPDAERADRMLWRLRRLHAEHDAEVRAAQERIEQINDWLGVRALKFQAQVTWLEGALGRYHEAVLASNPSAKTLHLPTGTLVSRMSQPSWDFDDAFVAWAKAEQRFDLLRVPAMPDVVVDKTAAKKALTRVDEKGKPVAFGVLDDGEKPPGVSVAAPERTFSVKFGDDDDTKGE